MSFDEHLFGFLSRKWRSLSSREAKPNSVGLAYFSTRLEFVGKVLLGFPIHVGEEQDGLYPQIDYIVVPKDCAVFPVRLHNERLYWMILLFHYGFVKQELVCQLDPQSTKEQRTKEALNHYLAILEFLTNEFPAVKAWIQEDSWEPLQKTLKNHIYLPERKNNNRLAPSVAGPSQVNSPHPPKQKHVKLKANPRLLESKKRSDNPLVHNFEKIKTLDNFRGNNNKDTDSEADNEDELALSELTLDTLVRTTDSSSSVTSSDIIFEIHDSSAAKTTLQYDEWHYKKSHYRKKWCSVQEFTWAITPLSESSDMPAPIEDTTAYNELKSKVERIFNQREWVNRQLIGSEIDCDAAIRTITQCFADGPIDQRIYLDRHKTKRDIAILLLVDGSLSMDSWVADKRLYDELVGSLQLTSKVLDDFSKSTGVATFSSESRDQCYFGWLKYFEDDWFTFDQRLPYFVPKGYTRIGVAIRHATTILSKLIAKKKILLLLSDAKPTDFDQYEGTYGIFDTARSVTEARAKNIVVTGIVLAKSGTDSHSQIFGQNNYFVTSTSTGIASSIASALHHSIRRRH